STSAQGLHETNSVSRTASGSGTRAQERIELAAAVEAHQIVAAADVRLANPDLRDGVAASRLFAHLGAQGGLARHVDLLERHALIPQELLGHVAVRAERGGVDGDFRHFSRVSLACRITLSLEFSHSLPMRKASRRLMTHRFAGFF